MELNLLKSATQKKPLASFFIKLRALGLLSYCFLCGLIAFLGALLIVESSVLLGLDLESKMEGYDFDFPLTFYQVLGISIVWPTIETAFLTGLLTLLFNSKLSKHQSCVISALLWGGLHGLIAPIKILTASWTFYIFSISFWLWKKQGYKKAFFAATLPHIILNSMSLALML